MSARGTTPQGARTEQEASHWVREMFGQVAPRYDLANHLLSFNIDRYWRAHTVARVRDILRNPDARALDLCCGTGDLLLALQSERKAAVFGSDFCHPMLTAASKKIARMHPRSPLFEADALQLPLRDASLDLITVAFGFRNLANYERGLIEFRRVLRPGGTVAILEFTQPPNPIFGALYRFYSRYVLPRVGGLISGCEAAYAYLPESVRKFPSAEELAKQMQVCGFDQVTFERMTFGIVALHVGVLNSVITTTSRGNPSP